MWRDTAGEAGGGGGKGEEASEWRGGKKWERKEEARCVERRVMWEGRWEFEEEKKRVERKEDKYKKIKEG